MIVLDTNVASALMKSAPDLIVSAWLDRQPQVSIWITTVTVFEIRYGLDIMSDGRRKAQLEAKFESLVSADLQGRILSYDSGSAERAAALMAQRKRIGRSIDLRDTMIAGIALANNATLATRNVRHFDDLRVPVVDPWRA